QRLPRLVGPSKAKDLIYTGRFIDAAEAHEIGLVDVVVEADQVYATAKARADKLAKGPTLALRAAKAAIDQGLRGDVAPGPRPEGWPYGTALELGCGTGFFLLNLKLAGVIEAGHVTDLSPGMVEVARRNATGLGFEVDGRVADAESIPYDDNTFDLVVGHAVLHHIPDVELAMREILRVLKPGGRFVFAGEPTEKGDWVARRLSRMTWCSATRLTHLPWLR